MIFDSHAHYDDSRFDGDLDDLFNRVFKEKGVCGAITCGTNLQSSKRAIAIAEKYDNIYASLGVYPEDIVDTVDLDALKALAARKKVVAIGEIGLEYHYEGVDRAIQKREFERQTELANELSLPIIVHDREAHGDTVDILRRTKPRGVIHCFSGSVETMKEILKLGMYIGLGGAVTFKNARVPIEAAKAVPLDRLLLETDAPYMSPVPFRGKRCDSTMIKYVAEKIAEVRGVSSEEIINASERNAKVLFGIE